MPRLSHREPWIATHWNSVPKSPLLPHIDPETVTPYPDPLSSMEMSSPPNTAQVIRWLDARNGVLSPDAWGSAGVTELADSFKQLLSHLRNQFKREIRARAAELRRDIKSDADMIAGLK